MRARLASLLFGGSCYLCRGAASRLLCAECEAELPRLGPALCPRCALPSPGGEPCGRCLAHPPPFDATVAALQYAFPADALIQSLKFRGELALAPFLSGLLKQQIAQEKVDCLVPVPLSRQRLKARGYNQAVEIARHLGHGSLLFYACERSRDTAPQLDLPFEERQRNVRGAFSCNISLKGSTVAIVDDVMTTGATLDEVAKTLKRAGAARVVNWVVARTLLDA
jgi:ComF family protein